MSSSPPPEHESPGRAAAARQVLHRLVPRTLTSRLVVTTTVLVALASIVVVTVTTLALRHFLQQRLDEQVASAASGQATTGGPGPTPCVVRGLGFGQAPDTVIGRFDTLCHFAVLLTPEDHLQPLDPADTSRLASLGVSDEPYTVHLALGTYRVLVSGEPDGHQLTGLPMSQVSDTVNRVLLWELSVALAALLLAAAAGQALVRRQLAPLRRVAATAAEVTRLPLSSGEVGVTARVPDELTDETTEVGQVGAALNAMLGHVEGALDARHESEQRVRRFVADASHELRTPLSTILGYAELSRRTTVDEGPMTHAMGRIQAESSRMASLVNDLLLLARLDSGRPLESREVDVSLLVAEALNDARVVDAEREWRLVLPDEPAFVVGDGERLYQVVTNLLANARRHTPPGTVVEVSAMVTRREGSRPHGVSVEVRDSGPGFPEALAGKEFERFSRGDDSRTRASGGAGLGLSIVAAIVTAHGGTVSVESRPGDTRVMVWLPSVRPSSPPSSSSASSGASRASAAPASRA